MEWLKENSPEIMGVIIAAYGLVRAIVALTPTKDDDKWLTENVHPLIRKLAALFGLDLQQGKKAK